MEQRQAKGSAQPLARTFETPEKMRSSRSTSLTGEARTLTANAPPRKACGGPSEPAVQRSAQVRHDAGDGRFGPEARGPRAAATKPISAPSHAMPVPTPSAPAAGPGPAAGSAARPPGAARCRLRPPRASHPCRPATHTWHPVAGRCQCRPRRAQPAPGLVSRAAQRQRRRSEGKGGGGGWDVRRQVSSQLMRHRLPGQPLLPVAHASLRPAPAGLPTCGAGAAAGATAFTSCWLAWACPVAVPVCKQEHVGSGESRRAAALLRSDGSALLSRHSPSRQSQGGAEQPLPANAPCPAC